MWVPHWAAPISGARIPAAPAATPRPQPSSELIANPSRRVIGNSSLRPPRTLAVEEGQESARPDPLLGLVPEKRGQASPHHQLGPIEPAPGQDGGRHRGPGG